MAEIVKVYKNNIKTGGLNITEATPGDDREYVIDEATLIDVFSSPYTVAENNFRAVLYDGLVVQSGTTKRKYIWVESLVGLLATSYTYPPYDPNYGSKSYNFVRFDNIVKLNKTYINTGINGIEVADSLLPLHILQDKSNIQVSFRSSQSSFQELEFPDKVETIPGGILIVFDPLPLVSEQFKITIL